MDHLSKQITLPFLGIVLSVAALLACSPVATIVPTSAPTATAKATPASVSHAEFDALPLRGPAPLTVQFHDTSCCLIVRCDWDYGDGDQGTSCDTYHSHTYDQPGSYTVSLTVYRPSGASYRAAKPDYIEVWPPSPSLTPFMPQPVTPTPTIFMPQPVTVTPTIFMPQPVTVTPTIFMPQPVTPTPAPL